MSNILFLNFLDGLDSTNTVTFSDVLDGGYSSNISFNGSIDGEGSEQRIEKRISSLVSKHIPEFTRTQNPLFVKFLRYYYEFIEQDFNAQELLQNINSYADIDRTVPSFVYYFLQNYGSKIPSSALIDKKFLVKKLNDLYQSKGSETSFKTLFRLLYDEEVSVSYPFENVLRPSDGLFVTKQCVGVTTVEGDPEKITNRYLTYDYNGARFETPIVDYKTLTNGVTEIQLDPTKKATDYVPGEFVYVYDKNKNILFKGNIQPTINSYSILTQGSGFRVGQIFTVNYGSATGALVRVQKVSSNTGVSQIKFVNFGYGYPDNLDVNILADEKSSKIVEPKVSSTRGTTDTLTLYSANNNTYFSSNYLDTTSQYTGTVILTSSTDGNILDVSNVTSAVSSEVCTLLFRTGGLAKYPGSYVSSRGFVSEFDVRLEDNLLNQPYAYQVQNNLDISKFYNIVIDLIHPSGFLLFNNIVFFSNADVSSNVSSSTRAIRTLFEAHDSADPADNFVMQFTPANITETLDVTDTFVSTFNSTLSDLLDTVDNNLYSFQTTNNENLEATDTVIISNVFTREFYDNVDNSDNNYFSLTATFTDLTDLITESTEIVDYIDGNNYVQDTSGANSYFSEVYTATSVSTYNV